MKLQSNLAQNKANKTHSFKLQLYRLDSQSSDYLFPVAVEGKQTSATHT